VRAAVLHAPGDLRIEERQPPRIEAPDDVLIRVSLNGLCGTDTTEYTKGPMMVPLATPHPASGHVGPTVLGHEFIGVVADAGSEAASLVGHRVACGAGVSCGRCRWCRDGRTNLCAQYYTLGLSTHGGLADYVVAPAGICRTIAATCADTDAALAQPLAVALHAVRRSGVRAGDRVVLLGAGAIGSFVCAALSEHDASVIALDIDPERLDTAKALGADETHLLARDMTDADVLELIDAPVDVVFETSGVPGAAARAAWLTRRGGTLALVGLNATPQPLKLSDLVLREVDVRTTVAHVCSEDLPAALDMLARRPLGRQLVDRVVPLERIVTDALEPLAAGAVHGKVLVSLHDG
jgi:(R,R)-butanediol dehydrogenase/meso-butanediol dehydrogenase/diacetyl reductase